MVGISPTDRVLILGTHRTLYQNINFSLDCIRNNKLTKGMYMYLFVHCTCMYIVHALTIQYLYKLYSFTVKNDIAYVHDDSRFVTTIIPNAIFYKLIFQM